MADFELRLKSRLNGEGGTNHGFQFRSRVLPDYDLCGYQVDNNLHTPWLVPLYDEYGRHTLAMRGERTTFTASGARHTLPLAGAGGEPWFRLEDGRWESGAALSGRTAGGRLVAQRAP